jgi:hypothetical protein
MPDPFLSLSLVGLAGIKGASGLVGCHVGVLDLSFPVQRVLWFRHRGLDVSTGPPDCEGTEESIFFSLVPAVPFSLLKSRN